MRKSYTILREGMNKTARDMCVPILISTLFEQISGINLKDDGSFYVPS